MIGIVTVTHGGIGAELLRALDGIVGRQAQALAVTVRHSDDLNACRAQIAAAVQEVDSGDGVALVVDMFGGTPSNLAIASMPAGRTVVLAGASLPMLVKLASVRATLPLQEAAREAEAAAHKYIRLVDENLIRTNR